MWQITNQFPCCAYKKHSYIRKSYHFFNLNYQDQFGFSKNSSCVMKLLKSYTEIYNAINQGHNADVDFQKAFNSVPHNELLIKLWRLGITGPLWELFKYYLNNRSHFVFIYGHYSTISGIPQGSVLGPLLFLVYVNDLPSSLSSSCILLFADNSKIIKVIKSSVDSTLLLNDFDNVHQRCVQWNLTLSKSKCTVMQFQLWSLHITRLGTQAYHLLLLTKI